MSVPHGWQTTPSSRRVGPGNSEGSGPAHRGAPFCAVDLLTSRHGPARQPAVPAAEVPLALSNVLCGRDAGTGRAWAIRRHPMPPGRRTWRPPQDLGVEGSAAASMVGARRGVCPTPAATSGAGSAAGLAPVLWLRDHWGLGFLAGSLLPKEPLSLATRSAQWGRFLRGHLGMAARSVPLPSSVTL